MAFTMKENDLLPVLTATLSDSNGAVDLQGTTILFIMNDKKGGATKIAAAATSLQVGDGSDGSKGKVKYEWTGTDTDTPTKYMGEFEVDFGGKKLTFPNDSYIDIVIVADLNSELDV